MIEINGILVTITLENDKYIIESIKDDSVYIELKAPMEGLDLIKTLKEML